MSTILRIRSKRSKGSPGRYEVSARGGRGREMAKKETVKLVATPLTWTPLPEEKDA